MKLMEDQAVRMKPMEDQAVRMKPMRMKPMEDQAVRMKPMEDQAVLTEMSVFYRLSAEPRTPVHKLMLFMVDPRSGVVERVVPRQEYKGENKFSDLQASSIPRWVISSRAANLVFSYTLSNRNTILCTYYAAYKLLACTGIKYNNAQTFYASIVSMFDIISVPEPAPSAVLYKACGVAQIYRPWNKDAFADIITNNPKVACCMAINESSGLLGNKRLLPLNILVDRFLVRAVVTYSGRGCLVFKPLKAAAPRYGTRCNAGASSSCGYI